MLARRQEIVASLQRIDGALKRRQTQAGDQRLLEELTEFRKATTERILELDAMVMALARERQATIRTKLSRVSNSKSAVSAYTDHAGGRRHAR
ncbi:flagellar protein FliT [Geomesophilobacter sediminis]|uniref:Flagellar protein FliT n=1 Tax=Geomesophilobacter sediminis TaxID=2798584 RepID=A0A8J7INK7_9BACT|nr:flagellar protein FliT [Geomesophilobacter sediminis]MBJ6724833.1 flagellar protein FliT [Geomesophilobacter sediminis]